MRLFLTSLGDDPEFLKLWTGGFVATLGFHVSALALQLTAAAVLGATPFEMGLLGAANFLPRFVFGLVAGAWVDRVRRRPLMIGADLGRAVLLASIPVAHVLGWLTIPQLWVVALGMGTLSTFFEVSILSYLPTFVGRDRLVEANSRLHAGEAIAQIAGPNLAGGLVQVLTAPIAIGFNAASYLVSAVFLGWIGRPEPPMPPAHERSGMWREVHEGIGVVVAHRVLRPLLLAGASYGFFNGGMRGALIVLYLVQLGIEPIEFGIIYSIGGAAALVGAMVARPVAASLGLGRTLVATHLAAATFAAFVPLAGLVGDARLLVLTGGQIGLGIVAPVWGVNGGTLKQVVTPDRLLGRVNATDRFVFFGMHPIAAVLGGWLASAVGLQLTIAIAAGGTALGALWLGLSGGVRSLRAMPEPRPGSAPG